MPEEELNEDKVSQRFSETLKTPELSDLSRDYFELGLDSAFNESLEAIPIVKTVWAIAKTGRKIQDYFLAKKIYKFLFQLKEVPEQERTEFLNQMAADDSFGEKVSDVLLVMLDRFNHASKAEVLGRLFKNTLEKRMEYREFLRLGYVLELSFIGDLTALYKAWNGVYLTDEVSDQLMILGLTSFDYAASYSYAMEKEGVKKPENELTELGKLLMEFGLKKIQQQA